jgi:hypothetical protein
MTENKAVFSFVRWLLMPTNAGAHDAPTGSRGDGGRLINSPKGSCD